MSDELQYNEQSAITLTIADRVNYPYVLANQLLTIQRVLVEGDEDRILDSVESLIHIIPKQFEDEEYEKDLEEATIEHTVDIRPMYGGSKLSYQYCIDNNIETERKDKIRDPWKAQKAVYNLLQRRGMLSKKRWIDLDLNPEKWVEENAEN